LKMVGPARVARACPTKGPQVLSLLRLLFRNGPKRNGQVAGNRTRFPGVTSRCPATWAAHLSKRYV